MELNTGAKMKVELLTGCNCGSAEVARDNLAEAYRQMGLAPTWKEVDLDSPHISEEYKKYGSPTILVNGKDAFSPGGDSQGGT